MDNFKIIHKVNINDREYYLHDHIVKKFDYFKPTLENRFSGELKVKREYNVELIDKFMMIINNSRKVGLSLEELSNIYDLLNYLLCNDDKIYKKLIAKHFEINVDNIAILLKNVDYFGKKLVESSFDKFVKKCDIIIIPFSDSNGVIKCYDVINEIIKFVDRFGISLIDKKCNCVMCFDMWYYYKISIEKDNLKVDFCVETNNFNKHNAFCTNEVLTKFIKPYYLRTK